MILPVILAGGSGSRLWPLSRQLHPKQFLKLLGEQTLFQQTLMRLQGLECFAPLVVCNEEHRFLVAEQLRELSFTDATILLEPEGRNTAPAIALAALWARQRGLNPTLLVLSADHYIQDSNQLVVSVLQAQQLAEQNKLVTFGLVPSKAETGYGYIKRGQVLSKEGFSIAEFVEKPDAVTAQKYVASGDYYWNSGLFMFKADVLLKELEQQRPDILQVCQTALVNSVKDLDFVRLDADLFRTCPSESIDYAVMEKTQNAAVVPLNTGWSDVGAWSALWELSPQDAQGNAIQGDVILHNTHKSYVRSEHKLVVTLGVENLIVVETKDAVLVANKNNIQEVKVLVEKLILAKRSEAYTHREVYRPWGKYDCIDLGERYQVKRISVKPGQRSSMQMHYHRSEHWVIVKGTAKVTLGDEVQLLTENQSVYIPIGAKHSIENPGKTTLELIEVQSGAYLGEDDIVRLDDIYGRN